MISNPRQCTNASPPAQLQLALQVHCSTTQSQHYTTRTLQQSAIHDNASPAQLMMQLHCHTASTLKRYTTIQIQIHYNTSTNTLQIQIHCLQNLSAMHYLPSSAQLLQLQCIIYCTTCTAFLLHDNALMSRIAVPCFNAQRKYPHHCCCSETLRDNAFIMQ